MRAALLFTSLLSALAHADSPLTSIELHEQYRDEPLTRAPPTKRLEFLTRQSAPNALKLVVASSLGWGHEHAAAFVKRLQQLRPLDVSAADQLVAGFLLARDGYLDLGRKGLLGLTAPQLMEKAAAAFPDDFAVQYAAALVRAQAAMGSSWCDVYEGPKAVLDRFPEGRRNLRPAAVEAAQGYLRGYAEGCAGSPQAAQKAHDELNQLYSLARLGPQVVAGAQGGVVVWDEGRPDRPVAVRPGVICHVLAHHDAVWAGCEGEVVRWDGKAWKAYLTRSARGSGEYYAPMKGQRGQLWVRLGARAWAYEAAQDRFQAVAAPWKRAYDALVRGSGQTWWVDFLSALVVDGRRIALGSDEYPGKDPRRLREDARGTLFVEDFEKGLFRYDDASRRFSKVPGLDSAASGLGRHDATGRLLLLHYTEGLTVVPEQGPPTRTRLAELSYMRDLLVDPNGDVWVAGWTGLMRLRPDGSSFGKQLFVAP